MSATLPTPPPPVYPAVRPYWDATTQGRLRLQRCVECRVVVWYPRPMCPDCWSTELDWFDASGRGVVYSHTANTRGMGEFADVGTYSIAYVELEEGPRVLTNLVEVAPNAVEVGMPVEAVFHPATSEAALLRFRPR